MTTTGATRSSPGGAWNRVTVFCGRAWLGIITGIIWLALAGAGFATVVNGSHESGGDILIVVGYTVASMVWGGLVVWSYRREPMRKMAGEIRDGQRRMMAKLDEMPSSKPAPVFTLHTGGKAHH